MRLFICHASEDKADFVRPLAEALRKHYEVWFDENRDFLTLGDSLLQRIDEGLASCDFGVVVLSKAFFGKKWTRAELDGLFAREGPARKIILPVWKDVSEEEVKAFSPILAGRLGVPTSQGVEKVVEEIRFAVQASEKQRELTKLEAAFEGIRLLDQTLSEKQESQKLLDSVEGVNRLHEAFDSIFQTFKSLESLNQTSKLLKFSVHMQQNQMRKEIFVKAVYGLQWGLQMTSLHSNSACEAELQATLFHDEPKRFDGRTPATQLIDLKFRPSFRADKKVTWAEGPRAKIYGNEELIGYLIGLLQKEIEKRTGGS
jgi:hypothetical protein